jgi:hypothetical protein
MTGGVGFVNNMSGVIYKGIPKLHRRDAEVKNGTQRHKGAEAQRGMERRDAPSTTLRRGRGAEDIFF